MFLKTVFILLQIHFLLPPLSPAQGGSTPHGAGQPAVQHSGCGSVRPSFGQAGLAPATNSRAAAPSARCQQRDLSLIQGEHHEPSHQRHPRGCQVDRNQDPQAGHSLHHRVVCPAGSPGLLPSLACICRTQPSLLPKSVPGAPHELYAERFLLSFALRLQGLMKTFIMPASSCPA